MAATLLDFETLNTTIERFQSRTQQSAMLNSISKMKFQSGRISHLTSRSSSSPKLFALKFNQFASSPSNASNSNSENSNQDSFPATYLQNSCGFPPEIPLRCSNHLKSDSPVNPNSVIAFFKNHNFSDTQISVIVKKWPLVFNHAPDSIFRPNIEVIRNLGLSPPDIARILTVAPYLLERNLQNQIIPILDFLRSFLHSDRDVLLSIKRYPFLLDANLLDTLVHNAGMLRFAGVPEPHIATLLRISPGKLGVQPENFRAMVDELQKLGFRPQRRKFVVGIMVMGQLSSSTWKEKIHFYERFGWSEHEVLDAFMKHPRFMSASADKITRALDLLVNPMGCDPSVLIKWPQILTLNFERTLVPRCAFHHVLVSKGLVGPGSLLQMLSHLRSLSLESFELSCAEKDPQLLRLYVRKFLASRRSVIFSRMMESSDQKKK